MFDFDVVTGPISARPIAPSVKPPAAPSAPAAATPAGRERAAAVPAGTEGAALRPATQSSP